MNRRLGTRRTVVAGSGMATAMVVVMALLVALFAPAAQAADQPALPGPIGHQGRWLTDAQGRVLLVHGVNLVAKTDGTTPADMGFGDDDAAWLAEHGFDVVRLGLTAGSVMPTPGVIDTAYLASFRETIDTITSHGLMVLIDLHQDGWGPSLGSDGFPEWMTITHGAENTGTPFPLYYVTNPAIQAAFQSFWDNEAGPGGVPLQDRVASMFSALADMAGDNPGVLGYDLLNEPWPGTVWQPCATDPAGCPEQDKYLDSFYAGMDTAIRSRDADRLVFGEPYTLFNFGGAPTNIVPPANDPRSGMSYHLYTLDPANEPAVQNYALDWANTTCGALLNTEWGATADVAAVNRQAQELDSSLIPWIWWAYNENIIDDLSKPVGPTNVNQPVVDALVRPHPRAVAGTPLLQDYDPASKVYRFISSTTRADGGTFAPGTLSELQVVSNTYPSGYEVHVDGGKVTSAPNAALLTVRADEGAEQVSITVWPTGTSEPAATPLPVTVPEDPCAPQPEPTSVPTTTATPLAHPVGVKPTFTG